MASHPPSSRTKRSASPTSQYSVISPLQIRKNAQTRVTNSPTTPSSSSVSPLTPMRSAPPQSSLPPVPASRFSTSTQGSQNRKASGSMSSPKTVEPTSKATIYTDPSIYSGLQVDDRKPLPPRPPKYEMIQGPGPMARENDWHFHQFPPTHPALATGHPALQAHGVSRANTSGTQESARSRDVDIDKLLASEKFENSQTAQPASSKSFFLRRRRLWILVVVVGLLVVAGVIVGAVIGSQKHSSAPSPSPTLSAGSTAMTPPVITPTAAPNVYDNALPPSALHANVQLAGIQFTTNSSEKDAQPGTQEYELYYNNHCGNTAQVQNAGSWQNPNGIIFTDAINGSGIAAINYWNATQSQHETTLFYIGVDNVIRDKRHNPSDNTFEVGSLIKKGIRVPAAPSSDSSSPSNITALNSTQSLTSYSLAAVFSDNFPQGLGARLFYHAQNNSRTYLQEMVYVLASDSWSFGTTIDGALHTSHLSMTVDEPNAVVRLMFATIADNADNPSAPPALQEYFLPLNTPSGTWTKGASYPNLLQHPWSQFSIAAAAGNTYLYYVAPVNASSPDLAIQEVTLPSANGTAGLSMQTAETVAVPEWESQDTGGRVPSVFTPVSAVAGEGYMNVFFAHGTVDALAGYTRLSYVSKGFGSGWPAVGQENGGNGTGNDLPLVNKCVNPVV